MPEKMTRENRRRQWDNMRGPSAEDIFAQLYQNARLAGATRTTVTTRARDDGGAEVSVTDDGRGAAKIQPFVEMGENGWNLPTKSGERPRGEALLRCFRHRDFTIRTRTGPGDDNAWKAFIIPDMAGNGRLPTREPADDKTPAGTGTRITFKTWESRIKTREAARRAADYLAIPVEIDGELVERRRFIKRPFYRRRTNGITFGVYNEHHHWWNRPGSVSLAGLIARLELPTVETPDKTWTVHAEMAAPVLGIRLDDAASKNLEKGPGTDKLHEEAERSIYLAIANVHGPDHGLDTESLARATALGVDIIATGGSLPIWTALKADPRTRRMVKTRRRAVDKHADNLIVDLFRKNEESDQNPDRAVIAETMLKRALELNGRAERAFKANPRFEGQKWYDRIPKVAEVRCFVIDGEKKIEIASGEAERFMSPVARPKLDLGLYDDRKRLITRMPTDLGINRSANALDITDLYVSDPTTLTVRKLAELLKNTLFIADEADDAYEEQQRFQDRPEHQAATILEGPDQADLRQMMRIAHNAMRYRLQRDLSRDEQATVRWSRNRLEAQITNVETGETITRMMTAEELEER